MPMISTTSEVLDPMGSQRLGTASSETATITALPASSTGMPAAISAPNTASSRISVIGTEVTSALWKSLPIIVLAAWSVLASPASATRNPGWAACTRATAARSALTVAVCARVRAGHVERDQRGAAVRRDQGLAARAQRGPDGPGRPGQPLQRPDHVGDRAPHLRAAPVAACW